MKKIVVIGATGMLGKPVLAELAKNNYKVVALSRKEIEKDALLPNVEFIQGDIQNAKIVNLLLKDAYGVHINLSGQAEAMAELIIESAINNNVQIITYISGITVNEKNIYFKPIEVKFKNEQKIISSGINYAIFKPTWFMESLELFVNNGRASYFGKQKTFIPFVSALDYAKMVLKTYNGQIELNKSYEVIGSSLLSFKVALTYYIEFHHSNIKKISSIPYSIGRIMAFLVGNKQLKDTILFMEYFEKAKKVQSGNSILKGETRVTQWVYNLKKDNK